MKRKMIAFLLAGMLAMPVAPVLAANQQAEEKLLVGEAIQPGESQLKESQTEESLKETEMESEEQTSGQDGNMPGGQSSQGQTEEQSRQEETGEESREKPEEKEETLPRKEASETDKREGEAEETEEGEDNPAQIEIKITKQPVKTLTLEQKGESKAIYVDVRASEGADLSYKWLRSYVKPTEENLEAGKVILSGKVEDIEGDRLAVLPSTAKVQVAYYYCLITDGVSQKSVVSDYATVIVDPKAEEVNLPEITQHPRSASYSQGDLAASLSVEARSFNGGELTYRWYRNTKNSNKGGTAITSSSRVPTMKPSTASLGSRYYYCVVTNTKGKKSASVTSKAARITIHGRTGTTPGNLVNTLNGIQISWKTVAGANKYQIFRKEGSGKEVKIKDAATAAAYLDKATKDKNGTSYTYKVKALKDKKILSETSWTIHRLYTSGIKLLEKREAGAIYCQWTWNRSADGYQVQYSADPAFKSGVETVEVKSYRAHGVRIAGLKRGSTVYIRERSYRVADKIRSYSGWCAKKNIEVK